MDKTESKPSPFSYNLGDDLLLVQFNMCSPEHQENHLIERWLFVRILRPCPLHVASTNWMVRWSVQIVMTWVVHCPRRCEESTKPYHLEEGEVVTRFSLVNLQKDYCQTLPNRTTRELVSNRGMSGLVNHCPFISGVFHSHNRPFHGVQTSTCVNCAKELEWECMSLLPQKQSGGDVVIFNYVKMTLDKGYLVSPRIDEARSEMWYLVWIAESCEPY